MTLGELFPGNVGRVVLTRVAVRLRMPVLLRMTPSDELPGDIASLVEEAAAAVKRG